MRRFATSAANRSRAASRPAPPRSPRSRPASVRVVGRVGPARPRRDLRSLVEPVGGELADRLEHRDARLSAGTSTRRRRLFSTSPASPSRTSTDHAVDRSHVVDHRLDGCDLRIGEHRQPARTGAARRGRAARSSSRSVARSVCWRSGRSRGPLRRSSEAVAEPVAQHLGREQARGGRPRARSPAAGRRAGGRSRRRRRRCRRSARSRVGRRGRGRRTAGRPRIADRPRAVALPRPAGGRPSGGTGKTCSPGRGAARGSWPATSGPGSRSAARRHGGGRSVTCSRLSSTSSIRRSRRRSVELVLESAGR